MSISRRSFIKGLAVAGASCAVVGEPGLAAAREPQKPGPDDVGMLYDATRCIGCRACVTACRKANNLPVDKQTLDGAPYDMPQDLSGNCKNIIKLYAENGQRSFMKKQCMHCVDPACVSVCMAGALHKLPNGIVAYDRSVCVGCRYCQVACPFDVPKFEWHEAIPLIVKCELCRHRKEGPACCEVCPREAVIYGKYSDLLADAKARIAAEKDRYIADIYGDTEGGGTHVLYLAAKEVGFQKLGLPELPDHPLPQMSESVQHTLYKGFIAPAALFGILTLVQFRNRKKNAEGKNGHEVEK